MNHFPHHFLVRERKSLPISLVYVFVTLARRLGVMASPVDFPACVIAHVAHPCSGSPPIYVDVFGSGRGGPTLLSLQEDIPGRLAAVGMAGHAAPSWARPASAAPMLLRATRNIYSSFGAQPIDARGPNAHALACATYVALSALAVLGPARPVIDRLVDVLERWPLDACAVLLDSLALGLDADMGHLLKEKIRAHLKDEEDIASIRRPRHHNVRVKHFVGMTFRHVTYHYQAFIIGWTVRYNSRRIILIVD
jgi:F-box protein 21